MAISSRQVTVGTSATPLHTADDDGVEMLVKSEDAVYLGPSTVTVDNGYLLDSDEGIHLLVGPNEVLHGVVEDGRTTVYILMTLNQ